MLAEALGIPTVAQIPNVLMKIGDEDLLIVDATHSEVVVNPDAATQERYAQEIEVARARTAQLMESAGKSAATKDGTLVTVLANVSCREDAAAENGADGIGLYRLEQFYLSCKTPPTAPELFAELRILFKPMQGRPVVVRLLDLGGDKSLPFLKLPPEDNPFLGQRGIRFLLQYPDLLDTQLQALVQFSCEQEVHILVPLVTVAAEMATVRSRLEAAAAGSGQSKPPLLGAMIETPAAALCIPEIISHADFLSIGTNDLTQYTVAASRENPLVSDYFKQDHPAVLRLLRIIVEEAGDLPVSICGELARQVDAIPTLLKLGIRRLSVAAPMVPAVKEAVRQISL